VVEDNPEDANDKIIDFMPISDMEISDLLEEFRPEKLVKVQVFFWQEMANATKVNPNHIIQVTERHEKKFNLAIEQMLQCMEHMWIDAGHPRFSPQKTEKLLAIVEQLMPKMATGWKEYAATGRARNARMLE
jgi:hypothetical protein